MNMPPRTAYILQIHQNPNQVNQFINQLISEEQADVYVHIDQKVFAQINGKLVKSPHVIVLKETVACEWGDISQVDATILLLREVLDSKKEYDFVCLRSGQDLLVKNGLKCYFTQHKKKTFLNYRMIHEKDLGLMMIRWPKITRKRYTNAHPIRIFRRILLILYSKGINIFANTNSWPQEYTFYKGSQWFSMPYEVARYIVHFLNENQWYYKFFENTLVPDESFFHTLIMNSPYCSDVINNNLLFIKWGETLSERNSPQNLTSEDIKRIEESDQFFARKFDENVDPTVTEHFAQKAKFERCEKRGGFDNSFNSARG